MPTLEELQTAFYEAVLENPSIYPDFICSNHSFERLNVYRQTILDNMRHALEITFTGVWKLLGDDCANSVAYAFCQQKINLPLSGCLDDWGDQFPDFLSQITELNHLSYLRDYAHYEWLKHQAYRAETIKAMDITELQAVSEDEIESVRFSFLPSVFCFASDYPLDEIESLIENPDSPAINLSVKNAYAIIARPENVILTFWVDADLWLFVHSLVQNFNLAEAVKKTQEQYPEFDLQQAIQFLLQQRIISGIIF